MSESENNNASSKEPATTKVTDLQGKYGECRRNYAASIGRYATDGCGEFIINDNEALLCAACGCHRNFHRKELPILLAQPLLPLLQPGASPLRMMPAPPQGDHAVAVVKSAEEIIEEEIMMGRRRRRRKRTKFTEEQKSKMMEFAAAKLGWKVQRHDDEEIGNFCESLGISRRVFKVWLSNNRHKKDGV